jgi:N-sulfoglucosamine sulfohydrolase
VRTRDWKYILNLHPEFEYTTHIDAAQDRDGVRYWRTWETAAKTDATARKTVERYHVRPKEELYDLRKDPLEQENLARNGAHADRLKQFRDEVEQWMETQGDKRTVFNSPRLLDKDRKEGKN